MRVSESSRTDFAESRYDKFRSLTIVAQPACCGVIHCDCDLFEFKTICIDVIVLLPDDDGIAAGIHGNMGIFSIF